MVTLTLLVQAAGLVPPPPVRSLPTWPPPGADPRHLWVEGASTGPLGRAPDRLFERLFRRQLVVELGHDVDDGSFRGVIELVRLLAAERGAAVATASRRVLVALFPDWPPIGAAQLLPEPWTRGIDAAGRKGLLFWFEVLFARPFPVFAGRLNAWVTWWAAQWLMGPCTLEDLSAEDVESAPRNLFGGKGAQVLVHRCRFLEEAACASVCVNACKMPTQAFFNEEVRRPPPHAAADAAQRLTCAGGERQMGVPMRMEPDYETLECRFKFGVPPSDTDEEEARAVACFSACPAKGALRDSMLRCSQIEGAPG